MQRDDQYHVEESLAWFLWLDRACGNVATLRPEAQKRLRDELFSIFKSKMCTQGKALGDVLPNLRSILEGNDH